MNRDAPNCLRAVCRGGLRTELGMTAMVVYSYFQNWDNIVLPCVLDLCRRTGRPFIDRMHAAMKAGRRDCFPVEITLDEVRYVDCPLYVLMSDLNNLLTTPPLHLNPFVQHVVAYLPMAESDAAFMARWSDAHNADWPDSRMQELRGLRRRTRALHIKSDYGHQWTSAIYQQKLLRYKERLRFAKVCLEQVQASTDEQARSRVPHHVAQVRRLAGKVDFLEAIVQLYRRSAR